MPIFARAILAAMIVSATADQARAILGAMRQVATRSGAAPLTPADSAAVAAADRYVFRAADPLDVGVLPPASPADLSAALADPGLREHAIRFLAVMALVDGRIDPEAFWLAWDRGSGIGVDTFAPGWDFWAASREPVAELRQRHGIPPLDPAADASLVLLGA
jgi:hypothetical protein